MQMQKAIIGKKVGMTQIFDESGKVIPVTVIEAGPCVVTQKKTTEKDGYNAVQLGFEDVKESKLTKPELGHLKKAEVALKKHLKEFRVEKAAEMNVGDEIKASVFAVGDKVDVTGISKGHGYEGPVKRCGGHRTPMTHGGGPVHRQAGSMGPTSSPSRIFKGHHGAGQMGVEQVTVENLDVVKVDELAVNLATYQVTLDNEPIDLTLMEYSLLSFLATHPSRAYSRETLLHRVWGFEYCGGTRTVDVHIRTLRQKLGDGGALIKTIRNVGYRMDEHPEAGES